MAADIKLKRGTAQAVVTTGAAPGNASITAGSRSALSAEWDNATDLCPQGYARIVCAFGTAPTAGKRLTLYAVTALDGTNYSDGSDSVAPQTQQVIGYASVRNTTGTQRLVFSGSPSKLEPMRFPASKLKFVVGNDADQTLSSSWTLDIYPELFSVV